MAISTEDQTKLLKVVTGLFNAAPGTTFLPDLEAFIDNGGTQQNLARELAKTPLFKNEVLVTGNGAIAKADVLSNNFGLPADDVAGSPATQARDFFTQGIRNGVDIGDLVLEAVEFLENPNLAAEFQETATLLNNKAAVAAAYSVTKGSSDLSTLQSVFSGVTGTAALTQAEIDDIVANAPGTGVPGTFTLTAASDSVAEGTELVYTVTASEAVTSDTDVVFTVAPGDASAADQGTNNTNLNDFNAGAFNSVTVTIPAGQTTATFGVTAAADSVTELQEKYSVSAVVNGETLTKETTLQDGATGGGQNFTMTTGVDIINGTSGNDTIIADNTGVTKQLTSADQIDGNGGANDTLKVFLAAGDLATGQPTLNNIDTVWINGGVVTAYTAATGTTGLTIEAPVLTAGALAAATYTVAGQAVTLKDANVTANSITTIASTTDTTQNITLNNWTKTGAFTNTVALTGANVATVNLTGNGSGTATTANNITLTGPAALKTLNIAGSKGTAVTEAIALNTITVTNTAGATVNHGGVLAAAFAFTGGAGNDTLNLTTNGALASLTSGAQLKGGEGTADKIGLAETALSSSEAALINQATGFEVLGLNAAINLDASDLTTIKNFSIDTAGLTQTINSMATGSTVAINDVSPTSLTLGTAVGVNDVSVAIGTAAATGITVGTLVTTGITNVSISSNGTAANTITTLTNSDNSVFTITGSQDLTLALSAGTAVGSKIDASALTGKGTLTGSNIIGSGDIIIGGSGADTINGLAGADTMTGNAGADTFTFTSAAAANAGGTSFGQADVITDFVIGTDKLQFSTADVVSAEQTAVQSAVTALTAGSTSTQIANAMAGANSTNLGVSFAVFGGNTYVLYETAGAGAGVAADDVFIQLTGVTTLPTFAADVIA